MIKVFLDTNVVCDFLLSRKPFFDDAVMIMQLIENGEIHGYISSLGMGQIYYLMRKSYRHDQALIKVKSLIKNLHVCSVDADTIDKALNSNFADFEDAMQYYSAMNWTEIEMIVTRNTKDYRHSEIPVFTPKSFILLYQNDQLST